MVLKLTFEQIKQKIEIDDNKKLISATYNKCWLLEIYCKICNNTYKVTYVHAINRICKICNKNNIKQKILDSHILQLTKLAKEKGDKFISITYTNENKDIDPADIKISCLTCEQTFTYKYTPYTRKKNCICQRVTNKKPRLTLQKVKEYMKTRGDILESTTYNNMYESLSVLCGECNNLYVTKLRNYKKTITCPTCNNKKVLFYEKFKKMTTEYGDTLLSTEYVNVNTKVNIKCGKCNKTFQMTYSAYRCGARCKSCALKIISEKIRHNIDFVRKYISDNGDELISEYVISKKPITINCGICKKNYNIPFYSFYKTHSRCPCTYISRGERLLKQYFDTKNIKYELQKTFPDCKKTELLKFDFYLPDFNVLIEFDGEQHFKPVKYFGGEDHYNITFERDVIKNVYCLKNNIYLYRIAYNSYKIVDNLLDIYLKKNNKNIIETTSDVLYSKLNESALALYNK